MAEKGRYDFLIAGAGLYGATAARELTDRGFNVLVAERRRHIAGNSYTEDIDGVCVHRYGPHIFHTDSERVWNFVRRFARFNGFINEPKAYFRGRYYSLPFNMHTFNELWGVTTPEEAKHIISGQISAYFGDSEVSNNSFASLEEKAVSLVGTDIFKKLIKGYTEKQWGRPCSELPADIITRIPVRYEYDNRYYSDRYQGIPEDGYTAMAGRMLDGIRVLTDTDVLAPENRSELMAAADTIVFTGPIDEYFGYCFGPLGYRGLRFETEIIEDTECFQDSAVVNYTDAEVPWTRITEHGHFSDMRITRHDTPYGQDKKFTVITREYPAEWHPGDEAFYPVRDSESLSRYEKYLELARKEENVYFGGRLGSYRYYDMDDTVEAALCLADTITADLQTAKKLQVK